MLLLLLALQNADLILHGGRVVTVDRDFTIAQALAVKDGRLLRVGSDADVLTHRGKGTSVVDLGGRMVLPGLIDSHVHPGGAAGYEFDHEIPPMGSIEEVLAHVRARAETLEDGQWIRLHQVFITRLREQRYPTRAELDAAAPKNPVLYATGPDAMLNSEALRLSGIGKGSAVTDGGTGRIEMDAAGEPTGMLRSCTRLAKYQAPPSERKPSGDEGRERLRALFADYNAVGLTAVGDRASEGASTKIYGELLARGELTVRLALSPQVDTAGSVEEIVKKIRAVAADPLATRGTPMLRIIGIKTFLDGGMLTGSAYMREPWGVSKIYSIDDPEYRGLRFIPAEKLVPIVRATVESGLQFTAHSVGDGAVHALLEAYAEVNRERPIRHTRPCITHCNFMSAEAIAQMAALGVAADIQPAWLNLDGRTLTRQFGAARMRWFQPLRSCFEAGVLVGGGSDHMQRIGAMRAVNPYHPFWAMMVATTRRARDLEEPVMSQEALSREQALRFYTINNARLLFLEEEAGSLERGKRADFIVVDRDVLTCAPEALAETRVLETWLDGRRIYVSK